jgi:hypothetical protein
LENIYNECRSLSKLTIDKSLNDYLMINFFEKIVESIKSRFIQKYIPFTLVCKRINIQTAVRLMQMLEEE